MEDPVSSFTPQLASAESEDAIAVAVCASAQVIRETLSDAGVP